MSRAYKPLAPSSRKTLPVSTLGSLMESATYPIVAIMLTKFSKEQKGDKLKFVTKFVGIIRIIFI